MRCVVCGKTVDWTWVKGEFGELFAQADASGKESLTEAQQAVLDGKCCSFNCYYKLED